MAVDRGKIEEYAFKLVVEGAESTIEDDMNEDGELTEAEWAEALSYANKITKALRANQVAILQMTQDQ